MTDSDIDGLYESEQVRDRRRIAKRLIFGAIAIMALVEIATFVSRDQTATRDAIPQTFYGAAGSDGPNYVEVGARVVEVSAVSAIQNVRLTIVPHGDFANPDGSLKQTINLDAEGYAGGSINLAGGEIPPPVQLALDLDGDLSQYPFDTYSSALTVWLTTVVKEGATVTKLSDVVPMRLVISARQHDWVTTSSRNDAGADDGSIAVNLNVQRGTATRGFALFELIVMISLAVIAVAITYAALVTDRPLEFSLFVWLGAMLFALPAIRNTMPGIPGVGTILDFAGFFWCLIAVAACLITAAITYIRGSLRSHHTR